MGYRYYLPYYTFKEMAFFRLSKVKSTDVLYSGKFFSRRGTHYGIIGKYILMFEVKRYVFDTFRLWLIGLA